MPVLSFEGAFGTGFGLDGVAWTGVDYIKAGRTRVTLDGIL